MIARLIGWSIHNRFLVLLATVLVTAWGVYSVTQTPLDALPDLSDTQVIIKASYPGKAPQVIEDQVTYPLTTTLLGVPGAKTIRAYSSFGDAFVYVLFDDKTDQYWARSRVLEYLNQVQSRLPQGATVSLGRMQLVWDGCTNTPSSTKPGSTTLGSCVRLMTGSLSSN